MLDILQIAFSNAFSWEKIIIIWFKFQWSLSQRIQLKQISIGLGKGLARYVITWTDDDSGSWRIYRSSGLIVLYCHYLNRWWFGFLTHIYTTRPRSDILPLPEPMMIRVLDTYIHHQASEWYIAITWTDDDSGSWRIYTSPRLRVLYCHYLKSKWFRFSWRIYMSPGLKLLYCHYLNRWWFRLLTYVYVTRTQSATLSLSEPMMVRVLDAYLLNF